MIALISRILSGDAIVFLVGGVAAFCGWDLVWWLRPRWARVVVGLILAAAFVALAHAGYEAFWAWYTAPLGALMDLR